MNVTNICVADRKFRLLKSKTSDDSNKNIENMEQQSGTWNPQTPLNQDIIDKSHQIFGLSEKYILAR
jgi:hypothetical protein